jgi:hypothetical protein
MLTGNLKMESWFSTGIPVVQTGCILVVLTTSNRVVTAAKAPTSAPAIALARKTFISVGAPPMVVVPVQVMLVLGMSSSVVPAWSALLCAMLCAMLCAILCAMLCAMLCTGSGVGWLRDDSYAAVVRKIMFLIFRP